MPNRIPTPGIPTPAVRKSPTAQPSAKPQLVFVLPNGNRVGIKDMGKNPGTPAPKPMPAQKSNKQYFADQKAYVNSQKKSK
jgi:hypothetical protein